MVARRWSIESAWGWCVHHIRRWHMTQGTRWWRRRRRSDIDRDAWHINSD